MSEAREDTAKKWVLVLTSAASFMVALKASCIIFTRFAGMPGGAMNGRPRPSPE